MRGTLDRIEAGAGASAVGTALHASAAGAVEIPRPDRAALPYRALVDALLARPGFRLDFGARSPADALDHLVDRLLGPGRWVAERAAFADDMATLAALVAGLAGAEAAQLSLRSYFAPGDAVWHLDRMNGDAAYRLVWPIGRPAGMLVTPASTIDRAGYTAWMQREHALLGALDTRVARGEGTAEDLWAHRPHQLAALRDGRFPFLIDEGQVAQVTPGAASIHRVDTPGQAGCFHRSSWANRHAPGLQFVATAGRG